MESLGVFLNEEWDSLSKMFSVDHQESDFSLHFIDHDLFPSAFNEEGANYNTNMAAAGIDHRESNLYINSSDYTLNTTNYFYFSQESSNSSTGGGSNNSSSFPTPTHENHHQFIYDSNLGSLIPTNISEFMDFSIMDGNNNNGDHNTALLAHMFSNHLMEDSHIYLKEEIGNGNMENSLNLQDLPTNDRTEEVQLKRKFEQPEPLEDNKINVELSENPKKKPRVSREAQKNKKKAEPKMKNKKIGSNNGDINNGEETNLVSNGQSSSCYSSEEDDSNGSQEPNGGAVLDSKAPVALNSNGKARASRGSATDPQSLYARKRRERINERLRILQNLVPNGTKVDISTMLEEAVHYVKFLQLQIKLLSSDDLWMYAPIAYNGMDMGLYQKISPTQ